MDSLCRNRLISALDSWMMMQNLSSLRNQWCDVKLVHPDAELVRQYLHFQATSQGQGIQYEI